MKNKNQRHNEIKKYKKNLKIVKEKVEQSIQVNRDIIQVKSEQNKILELAKNHLDFSINFCDNIDETEITGLNESQYEELMKPLETQVASGVVYNDFFNNAQTEYIDIKPYSAILSATEIANFSCTSSLHNLSVQHPNIINDSWSVVDNFEQIDESTINIDFIKIQITKIDPTLVNDFEHFINIFNSYGFSQEQYQELIGIRSFFWYKLISNYVEKKYNLDSKKWDICIKKFIFGKTPYDNKVDDIISILKDLWDELSIQNSEKPSAKMGNLSVFQIKNIFNRLINAFAAILKLREEYYR